MDPIQRLPAIAATDADDAPLSATPDAWRHLRQVTAARIALGRAGGSLPTRELLDFQLSHARARDAVWRPFESQSLADELAALAGPVTLVRSAAADRKTFLERPDLGRRLSAEDAPRLAPGEDGPDLVVIVSDGLSALAAQRQAAPLLAEFLPQARASGWSLAPLVVACFARVALADEIGQRLGARAALILLGERPGLGSPDSLGAYLTYAPRPGRTDAERNCVSNIRPEGLPPAVAAERLHRLISASLRLKLSGVDLKLTEPIGRCPHDGGPKHVDPPGALPWNSRTSD